MLPFEPDNFPIEEAARLPLPGMAIPGSHTFSPDGRWLAYLHSPESSLVRKLYLFDPITGKHRQVASPEAASSSEADLSPEERLRRERQRQYELGVTSFAWFPDSRRLLIPLPDGIYIQDAFDGSTEKIVAAEHAPLIDPRLSPDGEWLAFVQNGDLFAASTSGGAPQQLTHSGSLDGHTNGLAEYIAQEEMSRFRGYWWSPDSHWLAFEEVDESHIPFYTIVHQGQDCTGSSAEERHRYPFAGQANARVRLGVVSRDGGAVTWIDLGQEQEFYLARVNWLPDGGLAVQVENRRQDTLTVLRCDPATGASQTWLVETSPVWINLHELLHPLADGRLLWGSERSGFMHLYLYAADGSLESQLSGGDWMVTALAGVDEPRGVAYFTATRDSALETHLYQVALDGSEPVRLTAGAGNHSVVLDKGYQVFVDTFDSLEQPPVITLRRLADGAIISNLFEPSDPRLAELQLAPPQLVEITSRDGEKLFAAIFHPPAAFGPGPYPTIVYTYGGPHSQQVSNTWKLTASLRLQHLRRAGFLVFVLDNRGSARRGLAFESAIRHHMGDIEVRDQVDGVRWLEVQGLADPLRVGVMGWSYGGYMTLMCLCRAPETFKAGVAGAPVTSWDGYDTHYTERYLGLPAENPDSYYASAVLPYIGRLATGSDGSRLLIVHGLIDENVHFRHTARLINALIREKKSYDFMLFPDERHGPRRLEDRTYLEERIKRFFTAQLAG